MEISSFPRLVLLVHLVMLCVSSVGSVHSLASDESALLALKAYVNPETQNILANNWTTNTSVCNWIGVTCGGQPPRVIALSLSSMGLHGTIPPHIGNLSSLTLLSIRNNSFSGSLPNEVSRLHSLKTMDFGFNVLTGKLPPWIWSLRQLENLVLKGNGLFGTVPSSPTNITSLRRIDLSYNRLWGSISSSIFNVSSLQIIDLSFNRISGTLPADLPNRLPELKELSLSENQLYGQVPSSLFYYGLQVLSLSSNNLTGTIPTNLGNSTMLEKLSLSRNHLNGLIPTSIGNCKLLKEINFSENSFTGALPSEIGTLPNLEALRVNNNILKGLIPSAVFNISSMQVILLYGNQFSNSTLPRTIGLFLPNLLELNLQGNDLHGTIPSSISNASKLTRLNLADNSFTGSIPNTIGNLRDLQNLDLSHNHLTSESPMPESSFISSLVDSRHLRRIELSGNPLNTKLHMSIGNLSTSLEYLRLTDCKLNGSIPTEIGNLSSLIDLRLGMNGLTGVIPNTIGRLEKLQGLHLQDNRLSGRLNGTIQSDLCKLTNLVELLLGGNELSGSIPECLGNLRFLANLSLSSNRLTSTIPSALWRLSGILAINMSSNSFNGSLPQNLGRLISFVIEIDLSKNQLSGEIPSIDNDSFLSAAYISLADNRLEGNIPIGLSSALGLEFLDLSNNNLSGVIPQNCENLVYLKYLNLSFNELFGEIPSGGPFANFTAESYRMNRALCGAERLQVPRCDKAEGSRRTTSPSNKILWSMVALICILSLLSLVYLIKHCNKRRIDPLLATNRTILYQEIVLATDGFSESNLIGNGGFGSVYKGTMREERSVAIKVFNVHLERGLRSFQVESELLANIRHPNIVKLMNSCCDNDFKALVLEYMPNGTLDKWLYTHNYFLSLLQRLDIMIEVASVVCYLHSIHVIHCDLKPSNVLLDEDMVARVCDFSIAKRLGKGDNAAVQTRSMATVGYMAPEYGSCGTISEKTDVYSFGILLMEAFTGKKPTDDMFGGEMNLRRWIFESLPHAVDRIVDVTLLQSDQENIVAKRRCIRSIMKVAWFCTQESCHERKTMTEVESKLHGIKAKFLVDTELIEFQEMPGEIAPRISYQELKLATDGFSERNLLDLGEFGVVYKGILKDKRSVAIKIFDPKKLGLKSFEVQSQALRFIRHRNIVKILKCCNDVDVKALVLEYMHNWSLQKWLYRLYPVTTFLTFLQRLDLMINVASALCYLHSMRVIHCNLKPSNVLLDNDLVAHVSGFSIAKCLDKAIAATKTTTMATAGYMAPEYESMGTVSEKTDVYSFGILLAETFATIRPVEEMNWRSFICYSLQAVDKIVDLNFLQTGQEHLSAATTRCLPLILKLAYCCTAELADERKTMTEVESKLVRIKKWFLTDNSN